MFFRSIRQSSIGIAIAFLFSLNLQAMDAPVVFESLDVPNKYFEILKYKKNFHRHTVKIDYKRAFAQFLIQAFNSKAQKIYIPYFGQLGQNDFFEALREEIETFATSHQAFDMKVNLIFFEEDCSSVKNKLQELQKTDSEYVKQISIQECNIAVIMDYLYKNKGTEKAIIFTIPKGRVLGAIERKLQILINPNPENILAESRILATIASLLVKEDGNWRRFRVELTQNGIIFNNDDAVLRVELQEKLKRYLTDKTYIVPLCDIKDFIQQIGAPSEIKNIPTHFFLICLAPDLKGEQRFDAIYPKKPDQFPEDNFDALFDWIFNDPLTGENFKKPVTTSYGFTYEDELLQRWYVLTPTDPMSGQPLNTYYIEPSEILLDAACFYNLKNQENEKEPIREAYLRLEKRPDHCLKHYLEAQTMRSALLAVRNIDNSLHEFIKNLTPNSQR